MASRRRPEPVVDAQKVTAAVLGLVGGVITLLAAFGIIVTEDVKQTITAALTGMFTLVSVILPIIQARVAREKVTPLDDPRDRNGRALRALEQGPPV